MHGGNGGNGDVGGWLAAGGKRARAPCPLSPPSSQSLPSLQTAIKRLTFLSRLKPRSSSALSFVNLPGRIIKCCVPVPLRCGGDVDAGTLARICIPTHHSPTKTDCIVTARGRRPRCCRTAARVAGPSGRVLIFCSRRLVCVPLLLSSPLHPRCDPSAWTGIHHICLLLNYNP